MFNAAVHFVDRHVEEGRGSRVAVECGGERVTYAQVHERVNRVGNALRGLGVRAEERVLLLTLDSTEMISAFFGAIKIGAVPVPLNTLWTPRDYEYVLADPRARVLIVSGPLLPGVLAIPPERRRTLTHVLVVDGVVDGRASSGQPSFSSLVDEASPSLAPEPTHRDDPAFWLYSSGSTGVPKACVHLQHDMAVCADSYARGVLGITASDRCFSVAKLFFAYGIGN
jgi:benzoate-CoA ligase